MGCLAKVNIPIYKKKKIGPKTVDYVFVGYSLHSTTYRFLVVKSLYGLKQAPNQWHEKLDQVVLSYDFQINNSDKCVYVKQFDDTGCVILCLYVDDILILGSNMHFINDV